MNIPQYQHIDFEYFKINLGPDPKDWLDFIEIALDNIQNLQTQLQQALAIGDHHHLGEIAHQLKTAVLIFGLTQLGNELKQIQIDTRHNHAPETYTARTQHILQNLQAVVTELIHARNNIQ